MITSKAIATGIIKAIFVLTAISLFLFFLYKIQTVIVYLIVSLVLTLIANPFIEFLKNRLNKNITVFEYGGGNSTIWFAKYVKNIISVENDQSWVEHINKFLPSNAQLLYRDTHNISYSDLSFAPIGKPSSYSQTINETKQKYDIIIIDGVDRNNCIVNSLQNLSDIGIIIVDNFEFKDKKSVALNVLYDKGFKTIEFWGLSPMIFNQSCTTVFYKAQNCLNI